MKMGLLKKAGLLAMTVVLVCRLWKSKTHS